MIFLIFLIIILFIINYYFISSITSSSSSSLSSNILTNQELIDNLIKLTKFNNKKWKMIYQLSKDGFNMFHTKCNNHVNTLTLIQTNKSYIFAGYTSQTWNSNNTFYKNDSNAFIISLINNNNNNNKSFRLDINNINILCSNLCGPSFGYSNYNNNNNSKIFRSNLINGCNSKYYKINNKLLFNKNQHEYQQSFDFKFKIIEIETFIII